MSWNNHAYQFDDPFGEILSTDLLEEIEDISERQTEKLMQSTYKFGFQEFEGDRGKMLLDRILRTILPPALHRTWETIFNLPHNDAEPYVSSTLIAKQAGRSLRVIEDDLKRFKDMNLLETYSGIIDAKDGKSFAAERKNFANLYRLAHEYLLWEQSQGFRMYPPDIRHADLIKANRELYKKLVRFENYRRILENKKTGPKSKNTVDARWENEENTEAPNLQGKTRNNIGLCDVSRKKLIVSATYESYNLDIDSLLDSNLTQEKFIVTQDSPLTRSEGECRYLHDERGTYEDFTMGSGKGNEEQYDFEIPSSDQETKKPNAYRNSPPQTAKSEEAQKFGEEIINRSISKVKFKKSKNWEQRNQNAKERDALLKRCQPIVNIMHDIAQELNDQAGKSTLTTVAKIYERSQMTPEAFAELIYYARGKVRSIPGASIKVKDLCGQPNRVPLFIRILEDTIEKGLEAMQVADEEFQASRQERKAERDAELDAREANIARAENDPEIWADLRREIFASHERQQEIMAEVEAVEPAPAAQERNVFSKDRVKWEACQLQNDYLEVARKQIREVTGDMTKFGSECSCGCKIKSVVSFKQYCVKCSKPDVWSEKLCTQVDGVLATVPQLSVCEKEAIMQIEAMGYEIA